MMISLIHLGQGPTNEDWELAIKKDSITHDYLHLPIRSRI